MVRLRFQREGKPGQAHYRLVAVDRRAKRDGRPIEVVGIYNPRLEKEKKLTVNEERLKHWCSKGAQASDTVRTILASLGVWQRVSSAS
jgi:small subunit ribosomal protein S16